LRHRTSWHAFCYIATGVLFLASNEQLPLPLISNTPFYSNTDDALKAQKAKSICSVHFEAGQSQARSST
jgi:hypothetical protein